MIGLCSGATAYRFNGLEWINRMPEQFWAKIYDIIKDKAKISKITGGKRPQRERKLYPVKR